MLKQKINLKEFLTDLRRGSSTQYLMTNCNLDAKKLENVCRQLNRPDLTAAVELWDCDKLTDSQFQRAFAEVQVSLDADE